METTTRPLTCHGCGEQLPSLRDGLRTRCATVETEDGGEVTVWETYCVPCFEQLLSMN